MKKYKTKNPIGNKDLKKYMNNKKLGFNLYFSEEKLQELKKRAKKKDMALSQYIKSLIFEEVKGN